MVDDSYYENMLPYAPERVERYLPENVRGALNEINDCENCDCQETDFPTPDTCHITFVFHLDKKLTPAQFKAVRRICDHYNKPTVGKKEKLVGRAKGKAKAKP